MAAQVEWLVAIVVILVALLIVAFLWELARRIYYWTAARVYGSSTEEKFMRETASLVREAARAERRAKQNEALTQNLDRRRMGRSYVPPRSARCACHWTFHGGTRL